MKNYNQFNCEISEDSKIDEEITTEKKQRKKKIQIVKQTKLYTMKCYIFIIL